jgi:hypothetical protein
MDNALVDVKFLKDFDGHSAGDMAQVEERLVYGLVEWEVVEVLSDEVAQALVEPLDEAAAPEV